MKALFIVLNEVQFLDDILKKLCDLKVSGATILDSQGMASAIVHNEMDYIPLFGSLKTILKGSKPYNKTIFTVISDDEQLERVVFEIKSLLSNSKRPPGMMFTIPVDNIHLLHGKE